VRYVTAVLSLAVAAAIPCACTDSGLQQLPEPEPPFVDNLLDVRGEYCTSPAEDMEFPVKILVVMDQSASLQCTDQTMLRRIAVQQLVEEVRGNPSVSIGYLGFHAGVFMVDFTDPETFLAAAETNIIQLGPATDYQGVLSAVLQMLEQDMLNAPISLRARTKYVVMFVSDGVPEPRCDAGCEDDETNCDDGEDNDGDGIEDGADPDCTDDGPDDLDNGTMPDSMYGVCNTDEEIPGAEEYDDGSIGHYIDMRSICPEYNQTPQILRKIDDLMLLGESYGVGDLTFSATFLFAPQEIVDARCGGSGATFGYVREEAQPLLQAMAEAGRGIFQEVNTAITTGNFLRADYQPLESVFDLTETVALNTNSLPGSDGRISDTDGDGLSDDREFELSLDRFNRDTDNDGYGDLFEVYKEDAGFNGIDGNKPQICCPDYGMEGTCCSDPDVCNCAAPPGFDDAMLADRDGDGLNGAEERFLGTDERDPDTDGDRLPDGLEFRLRLDPTEADALSDHDFDGLRTRDEVRSGSDPQVPDAQYEARSGVRYAIEDEGEDTLTGRHCYDVEVNNIELVTTLAADGFDAESDPVSQGINRVYLYMMEEPVELAGRRGNLFIGCVESTYLGPQYKDPPDGLLDLTLVSDACYRSCLTCNEFETVEECRTRSDPAVVEVCDAPCRIFVESELFRPDVHCVSSMCTDPAMWSQTYVGADPYFMCNDNCVSDGVCNCNCAYDCDCNSYRSERCSTVRVCGR
jgi:hypothetical protein